MLKSQLAAADYRLQASRALEAAAESALAQVRGKLRSAAQAWIVLAELEDLRVLHARKIAERNARPVESDEASAGCA